MNTVSHFHLKELALLKTSFIEKVEEIPPPPPPQKFIW